MQYSWTINLISYYFEQEKKTFGKVKLVWNLWIFGIFVCHLYAKWHFKCVSYIFHFQQMSLQRCIIKPSQNEKRKKGVSNSTNPQKSFMFCINNWIRLNPFEICFGWHKHDADKIWIKSVREMKLFGFTWKIN